MQKVCHMTNYSEMVIILIFILLFGYIKFSITCNKIIIIISLNSPSRARDRKKKRQLQATELRRWKGRLKFCCFNFQNRGTTTFASVIRYELVSQLADWNIHPWQLFLLLSLIYLFIAMCVCQLIIVILSKAFVWVIVSVFSRNLKGKLLKQISL